MTFLLPKETLLLWQIRIGVFSALAEIMIVALRFHWKIMLILAATVPLFTAAVIFFCLPHIFKGYRIILEKNLLRLSFSFIFKIENIVVIKSISSVKIIKTPLSRFFSASAIILKATKKSIFIPELTSETVCELTATISKDDL